MCDFTYYVQSGQVEIIDLKLFMFQKDVTLEIIWRKKGLNFLLRLHWDFKFLSF
jgi:hypothetical protein